MDSFQDLSRFLLPQQTAYPRALEELSNGRKVSHWMWYIFPQLRGLGQSNTAWYYGIEDLGEAGAYLAHPVLGQRLRRITRVLMELPQTDPVEIFGWTDSAKLRSCMTLFSLSGEDPLFVQVLEKFYAGEKDELTLRQLRGKEHGNDQHIG